MAFVLTSSDHGRMLVTAANALAQAQGVDIGMLLADARAIIPGLTVAEDDPSRFPKVLQAMAARSIFFTPLVAIDEPDGLILDVTGCTHLWGSEANYLQDITRRWENYGYQVQVAIAGSIGVAWAMARYGTSQQIIESGKEADALFNLSPAALRIFPEIAERLHKLGLGQIGSIIAMPRAALRRRFGKEFLLKLDQAMGSEVERIEPVIAIVPYQERLPCLEPILTATGIGIALERLMELLCQRLQREGNGVRQVLFKAFRVDGIIQEISVGTYRASHNAKHLYNLFSEKLGELQPDLGFELFTLEAMKIDPLITQQEEIWDTAAGLQSENLSKLIDRLVNKFGEQHVHRYLPAEHYWPERSLQLTNSLQEESGTPWPVDKPRPMQLLLHPEQIDVTAPIPDYPPMLFRRKGKLHKVKKADGPERIEREWWLEEGPHRDYYIVEDENGQRYWIFRSGHYDAASTYQWFLHGFFA